MPVERYAAFIGSRASTWAMAFASAERPGRGRVRSGSDAQQCAGRGKTSRDLQTPVDRDDLTRHPSELRTGERCDPLADIGRHAAAPDRKSVVSGKSVSVRVDLGGRRSIKKNKRTKAYRT